MVFSFRSNRTPSTPQAAAWTESEWRQTLAEKVALDGDLIELGPPSLEQASGFGVVPSLHYKDFIFYFLLNLHGGDVAQATAAYYSSGRKSAETLRDLLAICHHDTVREGRLDRPLRMLDFASGYGCVTRHMRNVFPNATIHAVDIHEDACGFVREHLKLGADLSSTRPEDLAVPGPFDVVFAISFFSHVPDARFLPWLKALANLVAPNGYLIFTTHGEESHRAHAPHLKMRRDGYGSAPHTEQFDIPLSDYMAVVTFPKYVLNQIAAVPDVEHTAFWRALWWQHQDAYVLKKLA